MLEQQKLNQLALGAQQGYQLPMQRVQDVANIYGGIAGAMPGSPSQSFQPMPLATGIGGGLSAAYMLGMGGQNTGSTALHNQAGGGRGYTSATNPLLGDLGYSDIRLKETVELIGKSPSNINIYNFK